VQPNGRIPALIDHQRGDKTVWESVAILLYLVHHYDKENRLWFTDPDEIADGHQWLLYQASGIGPYFGQKVGVLHHNLTSHFSLMGFWH
jgi:glutathione S-transferase